MGVAKTSTKKGTAVTNKYQKNMPKTGTGPGLAVPDEVTIAMGEIAEGMLALAVGAGLQVMASLMEAGGVTFAADHCQVRTGHGPQVMATFGNLAVSLHRLQGATNIAADCRRISRDPDRVLSLVR